MSYHTVRFLKVLTVFSQCADSEYQL